MFIETRCEDCNGTGEIMTMSAPAHRLDWAAAEYHRCETCNGTGWERCDSCKNLVGETDDGLCCFCYR